MAPDTDYIGMTKRGAKKFSDSTLKYLSYFIHHTVEFLLTVTNVLSYGYLSSDIELKYYSNKR